MMERNFLAEHKNSKRILYLDIARGLAVFFMVMQHAIIMLEKTGGEGPDLLANFFILMGTAPAAPIFLLIMGIFLGLSKASVKKNMVRGILLFFAGYVLNYFRFALPLTLSGVSLFNEQIRMLLFEVDIFQLAGLSLLLFSPLKAIKKHLWLTPLLAMVIIIISPYLWALPTPLANVNPLWGTGSNISFPFFPWGCYPLIGLYLSSALATNTPKYAYLLQLATLSGILGIATLFMTPFGDYYRSGFGVHMLMCSFAFLWLLFCHSISLFIKTRKIFMVENLLTFLSKNVTSIYVIQWLLYGFLNFIVGYNNQFTPVSVMMGLMVMAASSAISYLCCNLNKKMVVEKN